MEKSHVIYSAMQEGQPFKTFMKAILGNVALNILNPFTREPEVILLHGDPNKKDEDCFLDVWSAEEHLYITRMNKSLFKRGHIIELEKKPKKEVTNEEIYNSASDELLDEILGMKGKWWGFVSDINKMTSEAPLHRLLHKAREQEKSEKVVNAIEARIAEIESGGSNE